MDKIVGAVVRAIFAAARWVAAFLGLPPALPVHPFTGLTAIGVLPSGRPVWPVLGGAPDDAEDREEDDAEDEEEGEDDAAEDDDDEDQEGEEEGDGKDKSKKDGGGKKDAGKDKTDVVSRTELQKAVAERQRAKKALRDARAELEAERRKNEGAEEKAAREAREAAESAAEKRYKPIAIRAALLESGVKPAKVKGAIRLLEMGDIEVDGESMEVTGLDDQLDSLKEDWPELFASESEDDDDEESERRQRRRRAGGSRSVDGADKERKRKPLTASERQAAQLLGKRG